MRNAIAVFADARKAFKARKIKSTVEPS